ncbi:MAG: F0F1 ATP synthase subunit delta [Pseudomonadota bacterium]|nr:F0F1 ATP synthase subunit delta [Pseudomonadota bacterium]
MASTSIGMSGLAARYASALFDLAKAKGLLDETAADLLKLRAAYDESPDLRRLVGSPISGRGDQARVMAVLSDNLELTGLTKSFVGLLASNRRLLALRPIIENYVALTSRERGEMPAEVVSPVELTSSQQTNLAEILKRAIGTDIAIKFRIDESLMGGLIVKVGSLMVDGSLRNKLQHMQLTMKGVG